MTGQRAVQARAWTVQAQASATERCGETLELPLCAFNAGSDKTSLSGSFEPQQEFAPVRMLGRRVDLTATCVAAAVAITDRAVPDTLRCGAVSSRAPNRRYIAKPTPTSVHPGGTGSGVVIRNDDYSCCGFDAGSMPIGGTNTDCSTPKAIDHQQVRWKGTA